MRSPRLLPLALLLLAACGGASSDRPAAADTAPPAAASVPSTGKVIEITMHTDEKGNYFTPAEIKAQPGDLLRFKLVQGVHNVHFLPDSNPGRTGLPAASTYAQLPGQAIDVPLTFGTGRFYFQCDPHAALAMVGHVEVAR